MKIIDTAKHIFNDKRFRFLIVGVINTVVGYGCYALFLKIGVFYIVANLLSTIIGTINSYFWNKYFTFRTVKKSYKEMVRFILVYTIVYLINIACLFVCVDILIINEYLAGVVCLFVTTIVSYVGHNRFSFKK